MVTSPPTDNPRRTSLRARIALLLGVLVVLLAVLEVGGRIYAQRNYKGRGYRFDEHTGYRPLPNIEKMGWFWHGTVPAKMNSKGFRDVEHDHAKPAGTRRIVAVGDSFTYGAEVDYGERFSEYLEESLPDLEVVNLGVNSFGTDQELCMLESQGFRFDPDIALLTVFFGNDFEDISLARSGGWPRPWYDLQDGELIPHPPVESWNIKLRSSSYIAEMAMRTLTKPDKDFEVAEPWRGDRDVVPLMTALIEQAQKSCTRRSVQLLVVLVYPPERQSELPIDREVRARTGLQAAGIEVLDTHALFHGRAEERDLLYRPGHHWTALGNRMVAGAIAGRLTELGWLE